MLTDLHQHIWTESLLESLSARKTLPFVRQEHGLTVLYAVGEQPYLIDVAGEAPANRARLLRNDGLDSALIALSSPIGIEHLPRPEAEALIAAYLEGVDALPGDFSAWGPLALDAPDPADVDALIEQGCAGISLPATALAVPDTLTKLGAVLERIAVRGVPLLIHPGPTRCDGSVADPLWWQPLTDYVAQMQAAWLTFATRGRREHPGLAIVFAMLAGGAPLLTERLTARGGPQVELDDPLTYYDTSSYGPFAIEVMARRVGPAQLVYGSDRPVVEPVASGRERLLQANAAQLLQEFVSGAVRTAA